MSRLSAKNIMKYEQFKKEAKIIRLKSENSDKTKRVVKFRGKIYPTASIVEVFEIVKHEL